MSHIFEHLYNPRKFLNNIQDKVNDIFISIPNMDYSLTNHVITFLSNEHTFFINNSIILSLFAEFGYKCKTSFEFKIHSIFYHFTKSEKKSISYFPRTNELINYFQSIENRFTTISIAQNTFIVPGSYYGQIVYYFLKNKNNILGFLDNDITKQNKRLHGTPLLTYSMEKIKEYKTPSILLIKSPYEEEIKKQLLEYNPNTKFIVL